MAYKVDRRLYYFYSLILGFLLFLVTNKTEFGTHGYDNANKNMKPYFLAYGPKIRKNNQVAPFNTVDLFSLFCEILEIDAVPNNGSFKNVANILINEANTDTTTMVIGRYLINYSFLLFVLL